MKQFNPRRHGLIALGTLHRSQERVGITGDVGIVSNDRCKSGPRDKKRTPNTSAIDGYNMPLGSDEDWSELLTICGGVEYSKTLPYIGSIRIFRRTYPFSHRLPYSDVPEARAGSWSCGQVVYMGVPPSRMLKKSLFSPALPRRAETRRSPSGVLVSLRGSPHRVEPLGYRNHWRGLSVRQDPLQRRTTHTKCDTYLLAFSLTAAGFFEHPEPAFDTGAIWKIPAAFFV